MIARKNNDTTSKNLDHTVMNESFVLIENQNRQQSIHIIEDAIMEPKHYVPTHHNFKELAPLPEYPLINIVASYYTLNREQYVMFCLATKALLETWLMQSCEKNYVTPQFLGYLGELIS